MDSVSLGLGCRWQLWIKGHGWWTNQILSFAAKKSVWFFNMDCYVATTNIAISATDDIFFVSFYSRIRYFFSFFYVLYQK